MTTTTNKSLNLLYKASLAFHQKRYHEALVICEKLLGDRFYQPEVFVYYIASALQIGRVDLVSEKLYVFQQKNSSDFLYRQLEAFLNLKAAKDKNSVLLNYIELENDFPTAKIVSKVIRKIEKTENFSDFQKNASIIKFIDLPKISKVKIMTKEKKISEKEAQESSSPKNKNNKKLIIFLSSLFVVILLAFLFVTFFFNSSQRKSEKKIEKHVQHVLRVSDVSDFAYTSLAKSDKDVKVVYNTEKDLLADYNLARNYLKNSQYNKAILILNKIIFSNAHPRLKEKTEFLRQFILAQKPVEFAEFSLENVEKDPWLYNGFAVQTTGVVKNLFETDNNFSFDLLLKENKSVNVISAKNFIFVKESKIFVKGLILVLNEENKFILTPIECQIK